jgi:hypothetical protein
VTAAAEVPRLPREVPDWHDEGAACRLFPELRDAWHDSKPGTPENIAARVICSTCPVRMLCASGALERGEPWGIWGGLDRTDRKAIAIEYGYPLPAMLPDHGTNSRYAKHGCDCADCRHAHAVYEFDRRARARKAARQRDAWVSPLVVASPVTYGRRRQCPGQYLLPLPGVPAPRWAEHDEPTPLAAAA